MSGHDHYPPSGSGYPTPGAGYPAPGPAHPAPGPAHPTGTPGPQWSPAPPPARAAHKPGAVPLRPLRLGDILDAAIRIIRFNPGATVGASVLFAAVPLLVPIVLTAALLPTADVGSGDVALVISLGVTWGGALVLQWLGVTLVTGMTAQVTYAAALGRKMSLGQAWAATSGARLRLVGLAALLGVLMTGALAVWIVATVGIVMTGNVAGIVLWLLVSLPVCAVLALWFWVKVYLFAVPVLMVERTGVLAALPRGGRLVTGHFWRVLGIALLTVVAAQIAAGLVSVPLVILGEVPALMGAGETTVIMAMVASQAISQIVSTALLTPFLSAVTALLYLDVRIRKEAFDVELLTLSGAETGTP